MHVDTLRQAVIRSSPIVIRKLDRLETTSHSNSQGA